MVESRCGACVRTARTSKLLSSGGSERDVLTDGRDVPIETVFVVDLCIVGTGPAGLAISRELSGSRFKILQIERGALTGPPAADLNPGMEFESPHFRFALGTERKGFGGMVPTWKPLLPDPSRDGSYLDGARYLPLDPIDFETRYWVPYSGWPITFDQMAPYYDRARKLCDTESFDFLAPLPEAGPAPLSSPSGKLVARLDQFGPTTAFTSVPLADMNKSDHVHLVTNAAAVELISGEGTDDGMATISVRTPGGGSFTVRSRVVVLAGGAIENARLLLNSRAQYPTGLGNQSDNVGRFFMEHPRLLIGRGSHLRLGAIDLYKRHNLGGEGQLVEGKLKLSEEVLRREELLNGNAFIVTSLRLTTSQVHAMRSIRRAINLIKRRQNLRRVPSHLALARREAPSLAWEFLHRRLNRSEESVPGAEQVANSFQLVYQPEQAPNRANRVTLSQARDAFGYQIAHLYWRWSEIDLLSVRRARQILVAELRSSGMADVVEEDEELFPQGEGAPGIPGTAHHLLGTTRMHDHPRHGVVDRACRVHGTSSVYVAGASVFTTGGYANPTLTVVALAIRLADELRCVLSTR
jgi:choline dehydrogenase-like flavoprotein